MKAHWGDDVNISIHRLFCLRPLNSFPLKCEGYKASYIASRGEYNTWRDSFGALPYYSKEILVIQTNLHSQQSPPAPILTGTVAGCLCMDLGIKRND